MCLFPLTPFHLSFHVCSQGAPGATVSKSKGISTEDLAAAMRVINASRATVGVATPKHSTPQPLQALVQHIIDDEPSPEPGFASPAHSALMALAAGPGSDLGGTWRALRCAAVLLSGLELLCVAACGAFPPPPSYSECVFWCVWVMRVCVCARYGMHDDCVPASMPHCSCRYNDTPHQQRGHAVRTHPC